MKFVKFRQKFRGIFLTEFREILKILLWNLVIWKIFFEAKMSVSLKTKKFYFINRLFLVPSVTKWPPIHYTLLSTALVKCIRMTMEGLSLFSPWPLPTETINLNLDYSNQILDFFQTPLPRQACGLIERSLCVCFSIIR